MRRGRFSFKIERMSLPEIDRRRFHRALGAMSAAGLADMSLAAESNASPPAAKPAEPAPVSAKLSEVELYLALIASFDPEHLTAEHLAALRDEVAANLSASRTLSDFPLTNADEPAPVFAAWRAEG
jgi:hypothetical protein